MRHLLRCHASQDLERSANVSRVIHTKKFLDGRPPVLLRSGEKPKYRQGDRRPKSKKLVDFPQVPHQSVGENGRAAQRAQEGSRELCQLALKCTEDSKIQNLLRQAVAAIHSGTTLADCTFVLKTIVDITTAKSKNPKHLDEAAIRYVAEKLTQRHSSSSQLHFDSRNLSLAASSLAKSGVWVHSFGNLIQQLYMGGPGALRSFNPTDIAQLCRFLAVFRRSIDTKMSSVWTASHLQLQNQEQQGHRLETTGLISLLRSLTLSKDDLQASELTTFATWLRARLIDEVGSCTPRQLASSLLDMGALNLLDDRTVMYLQREITRAAASKEMRARDLASILAGYSKFPATLLERQLLITPLLPKMVTLMPSCSLRDMCELLHGLASAHIGNRLLLEEWSSNFTSKAHLDHLES